MNEDISQLQRQFLAYHAENPKVYAKLVELARMVKRKGFESYSIKSLFEQVRWHYHMETNDPDFKLNNNYHSRYARLIMDQEEDLHEFFETRILLSRKTPTPLPPVTDLFGHPVSQTPSYPKELK